MKSLSDDEFQIVNEIVRGMENGFEPMELHGLTAIAIAEYKEEAEKVAKGLKSRIVLPISRIIDQAGKKSKRAQLNAEAEVLKKMMYLYERPYKQKLSKKRSNARKRAKVTIASVKKSDY